MNIAGELGATPLDQAQVNYLGDVSSYQHDGYGHYYSNGEGEQEHDYLVRDFVCDDDLEHELVMQSDFHSRGLGEETVQALIAANIELETKLVGDSGASTRFMWPAVSFFFTATHEQVTSLISTHPRRWHASRYVVHWLVVAYVL